jgi:hypothetical protein
MFRLRCGLLRRNRTAGVPQAVTLRSARSKLLHTKIPPPHIRRPHSSKLEGGGFNNNPRGSPSARCHMILSSPWRFCRFLSHRKHTSRECKTGLHPELKGLAVAKKYGREKLEGGGDFEILVFETDFWPVSANNLTIDCQLFLVKRRQNPDENKKLRLSTSFENRPGGCLKPLPSSLCARRRRLQRGKICAPLW